MSLALSPAIDLQLSSPYPPPAVGDPEWLFLLVGLLDGQPVSMASLHHVAGLTRVDDVLTDTTHRGKGYSRAVIDYMVRYHAQHTGGTLYLYTDNPTAERIYRQAGFVDVEPTLVSWAAWLEG